MTSILYIRGVSPHVKTALNRLATESHYPSLNGYLVHLLEKVVAQNGLTDYEQSIKQRHEKLAQHVEKNTEVMLKLLDYLD